MSREIYGVVQYMVDKNTWKVVPLYTEDNKFVTLWFGGSYTDTVLKDNSYRLDSLEAIVLNRTLAYDDEENPDWRVRTKRVFCLSTRGINTLSQDTRNRPCSPPQGWHCGGLSF